MKVAVFGKRFEKGSRPHVEALYEELVACNTEILIYGPLDDYLREHCEISPAEEVFRNHTELVRAKPDFLITLGGDGTILDATTVVRNSNIPILGINLGRLGFLANVSKEQIRPAVRALLNRKFSISHRNLIHVETSASVDMEMDFALNEVTVSRKDTTSMVTVHTYINGEFLNSYWADGLIIATATGSTGYSLSCGGPIIMPGCMNFVITPIAPHNLNVRPFVIPNDYDITLKVEGRESQFLASLDSRIYTLDSSVELRLSREKFQIQLVETELQHFSSTLRNKLLWGIDRRN